jgi:hypothetical protein
MRAATMRSVLLAALLGGGACAYAPSLDNGSLQCAEDQSCPKGYACASDFTCWKSGESPDITDPLSLYAGTWTFGADGTLDANCTDGSATTSLQGITIPVTESGSEVVASYYCDWNLHLAQDGSAVIDPGQSCMRTVMDTTTNETFRYTWSGNAFTLDTADGLNATVSGHVSGPFTSSGGSSPSSGSCDGTFSGSLKKTSP